MTDEKLRIAIFSDSALPILNGVSVSIDVLVNGLRNKGYSVHLYTAGHPFYRDADPNTFRFNAVETPWTKGYPLAFPPFYQMLPRFRQQHFDVIHTHTPFTIGTVGLRWAQSHDIPIVSTYHTLYDRYAHYIPFFPRRYVRFKIAKHTNFYYNHVDHIITPSEVSLKWLRRHAVTRPVTVIPTGIPSKSHIDRAEIRSKLGIMSDQRILLYVGRVAAEKNLDVLFKSITLAFAKDPTLRFWLVGDGPYREGCISMARNLGIGDRVRMIGFVPRSEVDHYYAASDLFVFSSITETQGLVVQEAMVYGLPAVVIGGGGAEVAVRTGENGIVVKNDPHDFANAILSIMGNEDLYDRLSRGASHTMEDSNIDLMCDRVLGVYRKVLSERKLVHPGEVSINV
jgi:glycosyltransferase involved in cell wall biosynthesis